MKYIATIGDRRFTVEIIDDHHVSLDGQMMAVDFDSICDQPVYSLLVNSQSFEAYVYPGEEDLWQVLLHGRLFEVQVEDERESRLRSVSGAAGGERGEFMLKAPMPGLVVAVPVAEGQSVEKGDVLLILESMKMQNELKAPQAGTVARVRVQAGETVEQRQTLLSVV